MTTNTIYTNLCDSVGAYEYNCDKTLVECLSVNSLESVNIHEVKTYPTQSAEQILRIEELILNLGRLSYHKSDVYYICILSRVNNANNGMAETRSNALYTLTHKLVQEGVLGKEEVRNCLNGK